MFLKAQVRYPFDICLETLSRSWSKRSKLMFHKSRSKEVAETSKDQCMQGRELDQVSPFLVCLSGTWSGHVEREA